VVPNETISNKLNIFRYQGHRRSRRRTSGGGGGGDKTLPFILLSAVISVYQQVDPIGSVAHLKYVPLMESL